MLTAMKACCIDNAYSPDAPITRDSQKRIRNANSEYGEATHCL